MMVSQLTAMCRKLFGIPAGLSSMRLYFKDPVGNKPFLIDSNPQALVGPSINNFSHGKIQTTTQFLTMPTVGQIIIEDGEDDKTAASAVGVEESHASTRVHSLFEDSLFHQGCGLGSAGE